MRRKTRNILIFFGCLGLLIFSVLFLIHAYSTSANVYYRGEEVFDSEQEYHDFKVYMLQPNIKIIGLDVLASEPPIWVRYSANVPREWTFPYDYEYSMGQINEGLKAGFLLLGVSALLASVVMGLVAFVPREEEV